MPIDPRRAAEELARREASLVRASSVVNGIREELFDRQLAFVDDPDTNKAAMCTRRAGKTAMWPRYCFIVALEHPGSLIRVWGITRLRAKQLLWEEFIKVAARHKIKIKFHETEAWIRLDNGSEIRFLGADKLKEAEKKRGDKTRLEVVLEAQLFGSYLRTLIEDVAEPCLSDLQGTMCLEGTPGPVPTGYWYSITGSEEAQRKDSPRWQSEGRWQSTGNLSDSGEDVKEIVGAGWSVHHWSHLDNPFLPDAKTNLEKLKKRRHWDDDHPTYVREWLGWWAVDNGVLFYKFNESRNTFTLAEIKPWGKGWQHVLGWDLGHKDDMALVAWGWHPSSRNLYEAASWSKSGAPEEEVMAKIKEWEALGFNFLAKVADTQGGGKITVEHAMAHHSQVFENASKGDKPGHVRLMNDDFLTGKIKVQRGGGYAQELGALPKDPDWDPDSGKPPGEDPRFPNHKCDAGLYSWRRAYAYLDYEPEKKEETRQELQERLDEERLTRVQVKLDFWDRKDADYDA